MESEAPPPYSTLPSAPTAPEGGATAAAWPTGSSAPASPMPYQPSGYKLGYVDFVPRLLKKKLMGSTVYEDFSVLIQRANQWIEEHSGITVISCETITWTGDHYDKIYADRCYSVQGSRALRGLRMWYMTEAVPSPQRQRAVQILHCRTFQPKTHETFNLLLKRVNENLVSEQIGGHILCVETIPLYLGQAEYKPGAVQPDVTRWTGEASHATVALCLRVYILVSDRAQHENIGYQDFVPEHNQRHAGNKGFEVCSELMDKATRWVARQQGVRFTNVQTLGVKYKKKIAFEERCVFTTNQHTVFLNIARVFYTMPSSRAGGDSARMELPPCRLTYRTFTPAQTDDEGSRYEDTRNLCDRVNQWLQLTGAQLFSIETVPLRMSSRALGSEATFFLTRSHGERWLYHIRVYLNGDYVEPPGSHTLVTPAMQGKLSSGATQ